MKTRLSSLLGPFPTALSVFLLSACAGEVGEDGPATPPTGAGNAGVVTTPGAGQPNGAGGQVQGTGGSTPGVPGAGSPGAGGGAVVNPGAGAPGAGGAPVGPSACPADPAAVQPGPAPLRRLTSFEYNNTIRDLLGDTTQPAKDFPAEDFGNGFGNDAGSQTVSRDLGRAYATAAEALSKKATETPAALAMLAPCASSVTTATEEACAKSFVEGFGPRAYRRPLTTAEVDELVTLYKAVRPNSATFAVAIATVLEALLQTPEFIYRLEFGQPDPAKPNVLRPTGYEMAARLSYLFWGTMPDPVLRTAAQGNELLTEAGVATHAQRMLDDPKSRPIVRFFFDNMLPISGLASLERNATRYPTFNANIGNAMREETQRFLEYEIFDPAGSGTWSGALTAPYTFVNESLAKFYGMAGVTGENFRKVDLNTTQRLGLLTQGGVVAGTIHANNTNPVVRGSFVVQKLMCRIVPFPAELAANGMIVIPDESSAPTARQRFSAHSSDVACSGCHALLDPIGFALENYDAIGVYRSTENNTNIDTSISADAAAVFGLTGPIAGPIDLVRQLATSEELQTCFAGNWLTYAYGRKLVEADACTKERVNNAFKTSGYNIKQLLLQLTKTDAFLYLPKP